MGRVGDRRTGALGAPAAQLRCWSWITRSLGSSLESPRPQAPSARSASKLGALLPRSRCPVFGRAGSCFRGERGWGEWLSRGARHAFAPLSRQVAERVRGLCSKLSPLSSVGPVELLDVERLLSRRMGSAVVRSTGHGAGKVFVGSIDDAAGRSSRASVHTRARGEGLFRHASHEDPILPDGKQTVLGPRLMVTEERAARERLLLRLGVRAARGEVINSPIRASTWNMAGHGYRPSMGSRCSSRSRWSLAGLRRAEPPRASRRRGAHGLACTGGAGARHRRDAGVRSGRARPVASPRGSTQGWGTLFVAGPTSTC